MPAKENRVYVADFGVIPPGSDNLVAVPGRHGDCLLHAAIAGDYIAMVACCKADTGIDLVPTSGWRAFNPWTKAQYNAYLIKTYRHNLPAGATDKQIIAFGRVRKAFQSPHTTGLAVDFGSGGLDPNPPADLHLTTHTAATIEAQRHVPVYLWLVENAHRFGFTPYPAEPWHWEHKISLAAWQTGVAEA